MNGTPRYSPATLARLAVSAAARGIADRAGRLAETDDDTTSPADVTRRAYALRRAADELLALAAVADREAGETWDDIGAALGGRTRQAAYNRYHQAEAAFRRRLLLAWLGDPQARVILGPLADPGELVADLTGWARRHGRGDVGPGLAAETAVDRVALVMNAAELLDQLADDPTMTPDRLRALRLALARREVELYGELLEINPADRTAAANLAYARQRLAEMTDTNTDAETRTA